MAINNFLAKYLCFAAGYTILHKLPKIWNGTIDNRPLLFGEKTCIMGASLIYGPLLAIPWMLDDVNIIEIYLKGHDKKDYGYTKYTSAMDYVFY